MVEVGRKREGEEGEGEVRVFWLVVWFGFWVFVYDLVRGILYCIDLVMG